MEVHEIDVYCAWEYVGDLPYFFYRGSLQWVNRQHSLADIDNLLVEVTRNVEYSSCEPKSYHYLYNCMQIHELWIRITSQSLKLDSHTWRLTHCIKLYIEYFWQMYFTRWYKLRNQSIELFPYSHLIFLKSVGTCSSSKGSYKTFESEIHSHE